MHYLRSALYWYHRFFPGEPTYTEGSYPDLTGKVYLVTGSTTGIGFETARLLLSQGAKVWIAGRSQSKLDGAVERLTASTMAADRLDTLMFDLGDLTTLKKGASKLLDHEKRLDGVVHNAGVMMPPAGSVTKQGLEMQLGTNCVGPWLLQRLLTPLMVATAKNHALESTVRVVWVSSLAHILAPHGGMNWADKNFEHSSVHRATSYGQSKAVNAQQAIVYGRSVRDAGIVSLSVHPGIIKSDLARHMSYAELIFTKMMQYDTVYGSYTELYALLSPNLSINENGVYIEPFERIQELRPDVRDAVAGDGGDKLEAWLNEQTSQYM